MRHACLACLLLVGCGNNNTNGVVDAPHAIDAAPDAAADAATPDAPATTGDGAMPTGTTYHYILDHVIVPQTNTQAHTYGLDLNNDGTIDNQLGMVFATLGSQGLALQPALDQAIDRGSILQLAQLQASDFTTATAAGFTLFKGADPNPAPCASTQDTVCRHHLDGTGTFTIASGSAMDPPLVGNISGGTLLAGPGDLTLTLALQPGTITDLPLYAARVKASSMTATGVGALVIAGAVLESDINSKVLPAAQVGFTAQIAADCTALQSPPQCGCTSGSQGATLIALFDANHDCKVSVTELQNNSLVQSLLAPDLTVNGQPAISLGLGATAVKATY